MLNGETFNIEDNWECAGEETDFGYDFWYQPRHNVMVSSEWGEPNTFLNGFNPADVAKGIQSPFLSYAFHLLFLYPSFITFSLPSFLPSS